jgi:hypothetical protein
MYLHVHTYITWGNYFLIFGFLPKTWDNENIVEISRIVEETDINIWGSHGIYDVK